MLRIKVHLTGPFKVELPSGEDVTPRGAKEQALIALLLTSPTGGRTRGWLQAHLWSDRQKKQAADSLRQADYKVRQALGPDANVLSSSKQAIQIAQDEVEEVETPGLEFLEGLDVRDEAFNEWLMTERSRRADLPVDSEPEPQITLIPAEAPVASSLLPSTIYLRQRSEPGAPLWWPERFVSDAVTQMLGDEFSLSVSETPRLDGSKDAWRIDVDGFQPTPDAVGVRLSLTDGISGNLLWAKSQICPVLQTAQMDRPEIHQIVHELCQSLGNRMMQSAGMAPASEDPDLLCQQAIKLLFTMQADQIQTADRLFDQAYSIKPRGLYLAWKAQLREIQMLERLATDPQGLKDEVRDLVQKAISTEPDNSMVQALVANAQLYVEGDIDASLNYASRAVHLNPGNAMGRWALSSAQLFSHQVTESYRNAKMASFLTEGTALSFWSKSQQGGAAIALGRLDEAKSLFKSAVADCPSFRPAMRYLFAIHACMEEWDLANEAAAKLRAIEPDFTIERLAIDKDYPVALLRLTDIDTAPVLQLA